MVVFFPNCHILVLTIKRTLEPLGQGTFEPKAVSFILDHVLTWGLGGGGFLKCCPQPASTPSILELPEIFLTQGKLGYCEEWALLYPEMVFPPIWLEMPLY